MNYMHKYMYSTSVELNLTKSIAMPVSCVEQLDQVHVVQ